MEEALIAKLLADAGVSALVGTRIYPGVRPQAGPLPAIVFNLISATPSYSDVEGRDGGALGLRRHGEHRPLPLYHARS